MALLRVHDIIYDGCQDGHHLGFYSRFKFIWIMQKLQNILFPRVVKYDTIEHFVALGGTSCFVFQCKKVKNMHFCSKNNGLTLSYLGHRISLT